MWVRKQLDIGWCDLLFGMAACFGRVRGGSICGAFGTDDDDRSILVCQSVRSGFDLLLGACNWPAGSEIIVSALTIGDMVRIIQEHGLVPIPIDLDAETAAPRPADLERLLSPRTRGILVAHLFGGWIPLDPFVEFARKHGLCLIEDCAQAFDGEGVCGNLRADVSMFSFGTIKTATALGGGVFRLRDRIVAEQMTELEKDWPQQPRIEFLQKLLKYACLKALSAPEVFALLAGLCRLLNLPLDRWLNRTVRGFPGPDFWVRLRRRPCGPLQLLLRRRLSQNHGEAIGRRRSRGDGLRANLAGVVECPGTTLSRHSHWVFPIAFPEPARLIQSLRSAGFDATQGESLIAVEAPDDRPDLIPHVAQRLLREMVYLPCYGSLPFPELERMALAVRACAECNPVRSRCKSSRK